MSCKSCFKGRALTRRFFSTSDQDHANLKTTTCTSRIGRLCACACSTPYINTLIFGYSTTFQLSHARYIITVAERAERVQLKQRNGYCLLWCPVIVLFIFITFRWHRSSTHAFARFGTVAVRPVVLFRVIRCTPGCHANTPGRSYAR